MFIKEISVSASRTINLGNYNSIKVEGSCTVHIDETEQDDLFIQSAREIAMAEVKTQLVETYKKIKPPEKTND